MINLTAPINNLGYGIAGYNILKQLHSRDGVALYPIGTPDIMPDMSIVEECIRNQKNANTSCPSVRLWHQHDLMHQSWTVLSLYCLIQLLLHVPFSYLLEQKVLL